ncbi:MAG: chorismate lyase [Gammaproteobacteria bacterium]
MPPLMGRVSTAAFRVGKHYSTPVWRPENQWLRYRLADTLRSWLMDTGSLTQRIKQHCQGCFRVQVLDQGWGYPGQDERSVLHISPRQRVIIRQVQLLCDGKPWVFARTIIPVSTLQGPQRRLQFLGDRPLGAYLFSDPSMRRGSVEMACISRQHALYVPAVTGIKTKPAHIWGRRSVFHVSNKPLLVCEMFLPDLIKSSLI